MPPSAGSTGLAVLAFKNRVRNRDIQTETSMEDLIALLRRRLIQGSRDCAEATALLLSRVIETSRQEDVRLLLNSIREIGIRLARAQPQELSIGNLVRRVMALIREEAEEDRDGAVSSLRRSQHASTSCRSQLPSREVAFKALKIASDRSLHPLPRSMDDSQILSSVTQGERSMFDLLSIPQSSSFPLTAPSARSQAIRPTKNKGAAANRNAAKELRAEIMEGIEEIIEELRQADEQIASYALEHIHSNEIVLIHGYSKTIQLFLCKAAAKRKFTTVHVERYPGDSLATHTAIPHAKVASQKREQVEAVFLKALTAAGITVVSVPASAVFSMMSRVNKVLLNTHAVLANGDLIAASGSQQIAKAAKFHRTPVLALNGIYQLCPVYPCDLNVSFESGEPWKVVAYKDGNFVNQITVVNPAFDHLSTDLIELYITNLGGHAPSYLYRIIADHYRSEDIDLNKPMINGSG